MAPLALHVGTGTGIPPTKQAQAFVALCENGLSTDVRAGENCGVTLWHDSAARPI